MDPILKGELKQIYVNVPDFDETFFGGVVGLKPGVEAVFKNCKRGKTSDKLDFLTSDHGLMLVVWRALGIAQRALGHKILHHLHFHPIRQPGRRLHVRLHRELFEKPCCGEPYPLPIQKVWIQENTCMLRWRSNSATLFSDIRGDPTSRCSTTSVSMSPRRQRLSHWTFGVSLLERFYDPTNGDIRAFGHSIASLDNKAYHSMLGLVLQETILYRGSVREILLLGIPSKLEH